MHSGLNLDPDGHYSNLSNDEFLTLHRVVSDMNAKILSMSEQITTLEDKLIEKDQEIKKLRAANSQ